MEYKKWGLSVVAFTLIALLLFGSITAIVDPYFHFHKPLEALEYPLYDEHYQSDGILRHFDYDTLIIGSSMTSNFKTSQLDALFETNSVKVPLSACTYKELNSNLLRAFAANPNIETVFIGLDGVSTNKDAFGFDLSQYPTYLTDDSLINDVNYLFNKEVLIAGSLRVFTHTLQGKKTTSFDEYDNFMDAHHFGKEYVLLDSGGKRPAQPEQPLSEKDRQLIIENIQQNITSLLEEHPNVQFYGFFPPYSMYYFYVKKQLGSLQSTFEIYKTISSQLLQYDNIKLFSFLDELDITANPDIYMDIYHYSEDVNTQMLIWMHEENHLLTKENYIAYWDSLYETINSFDYDPLF